MSYSRNLFIYRASAIADVAALIVAWLYAAKVSGRILAGFSLRYMMEMRFSVANLLGALTLIGMWILIFHFQDLYRPRVSRVELRDDVNLITKAVTIATVLFAAVGLFFGISLFSPLFLAVFWPAAIILDTLFRGGLAKLLGRLHLGDHNQRNIVIIGTNQTAWNYASGIRGTHAGAYHLLGFIDDLVVITDSRMYHIGQLKDFNALLENYVIDEVVIAMPMHSCSKAIQDIIDHSHERGIAVRFPMSQIFSGLTRTDVWRVRAEATLGSGGDFGDDLVVYSGYQLGGLYLAKRVFDVAFASFMVLLTLPLMAAAALAIYLGSGRPVFFVQDRYGYNGRVFKLFKFRTMVTNADAMQDKLRAQNERDGAAFKMKNDPRVTRVGNFLRKTSIDELPQLFNVIFGDMSMVGPRPLPLADYRRMSNISHRRRLSVLPGITGPWQISGRDQISFEEWMQMDLDYIDHWRLATDFKILFLTVPVVLLARGAK